MPNIKQEQVNSESVSDNADKISHSTLDKSNGARELLNDLMNTKDFSQLE